MIVTEWLTEKWFDIFFAIVLAFIFAIVTHKIYKKIKPETKLSGKTIYKRQIPTLAFLILPNKKEIKITKFDETFGREDFVSVIPVDKLQFIGRKHFKIIKNDNGRYIEDMDSANGTKLDKKEIKGEGQQKLEDGAKIKVADVLDLEYKVVIDGK